MTKYRPLSERLSGYAEDEWRTTFSELEAVLGFALPKTARGGANWWVNDADKGHSRSWMEAGWEVSSVDRTGETVIFRRNVAQSDIEAAGGVESLETAGEIPPQPASAADSASRLRKAVPFMAAGAAVLAGVAALVARNVIRRREPPRAG